MRTEAARGRRHAAHRYRSERIRDDPHTAPLVDAEVVSSLSEALPTPIDRELLEDFIAECREHVQHIEVALLALETDPDDREAIDTALRAFHTTKGTAACLRLTPIADLAHHTESLLSRMRDGEIRCTGGMLTWRCRRLTCSRSGRRRCRTCWEGQRSFPLPVVRHCCKS